MSDQDQLHAMRHSVAHIMATAVQHLWPEAKFGVGPVVENGCYYDIDLGKTKISEEDFKKIEAEMKKIVNSNDTFQKSTMQIDEAIDWAKKNEQPYKLELLNDLNREGTTLAKELDASMMGMALPAGITGSTRAKASVGEVSFYTNGDFVDLCRGPHVESTGKVGAFKLMRVAGAYWRGDEKKAQMQRLYAAVFETKEELNKHLEMLEEAKKRDHRRLGQELDLFTISDLVGGGLPLFTPRGTVLREELGNFSLELQKQYGFQKVWTPHMAKEELYKASGHFDKYPERFSVSSEESTDKFMLKPMNCPHHIQLFLRKQWSYREMPVRYMENTTNYRDEKSGELHGLSRVRAISQDDGHIFCREDDIEQEIINIIRMIKDMYTALNMSFYARLSYRDDTDKYLGDKELWDKAEAIIAKAAKSEKLESVDGPGEAAFYGPKIDFMVRDAIGREWQCATIQLDFVQPERFNLEYDSEDGGKKRPVMIHKALLGATERFLSVYIEHTAGKFPVWLAPEQVRIASVNQEKETLKFVSEFVEKAEKLGIRVGVDNDNESVGKKIRTSEMAKVPYTLIIGQKEIESGKVMPRTRADLVVHELKDPVVIDNFLESVANEAKSRVSKSSF